MGDFEAPTLESLSRDESKSAARLDMLHNLAARLNRLNDVHQIGEAITGELRSVIDYHNCRVFVLSPDGEWLLPIAFKGVLFEYQQETFEELVTRVGEGLTGWVGRFGESVYAPDAENDPRSIRISGTDAVDESMILVPLLYGERVMGVVVLSKLGIDQFDDADVRLLEVLAAHAATAIENARLLDLEREIAARATESEARKSAILESALDCIVAIDHRGVLVEFNPAAEQVFGYSRSEALGREMAELIIPPELREAHRDGLARYLATGGEHVIGQRVELTAMRADGTRFPVELTVTRVDLPGPPMFTGYVRDIRERKRAEAELERALANERDVAHRLRALDEMKNTFLQAVSHDLRTPLAAVLGISITLGRKDLVLPPATQHDLVNRLAANARKLDRILSNLLDLDRLMRGVMEPARHPTDVGALVRRVVGEADFLGSRHIEVEAPSLIAPVDAAKVERIIENLLVNTGKHTPPGTPIWVRVSPDPAGVLITVEDAGRGVPQEYRESIFEPFRQGPDEHHSPGSGIGLSLVARFAELHGGRAWVEDRAGGGASFRVLLP